MVHIIIDFAFKILFPKICLGCGYEGAFACDECIPTLEISPPQCFVCESRSFEGLTCKRCLYKSPIRRFFAPLKYDQKLTRELIHALKFKGVHDIINILAPRAINALSFYQFVKKDTNIVFVPIPLRQKRLRERGFNQAELFAIALNNFFNKKIDTSLLIRSSDRPPQTSIKKKEERMQNIAGVFQATRITSKDVTYVLVDDVATTGATLNDAARALKEAGAETIWGITAAR
jgi:ComF family protein